SLARAAYARTSAYDAAIAGWLAERQEEPFPESFGPARRATRLRYGENPHQEAALYVDPLAPEGSLVRARVLGGKEDQHGEGEPAPSAGEIHARHVSTCAVGAARADDEVAIRSRERAS
ncbi:MAG TPA: hypothetical protein VIC87_13485, partial [Vicinamibacteria bacterium]